MKYVVRAVVFLRCYILLVFSIMGAIEDRCMLC